MPSLPATTATPRRPGAPSARLGLEILCRDAAMQTAVVMVLVSASILMGILLTITRVPQNFAAAITSWTGDKWPTMLILNMSYC
jgi:TRAP-type C4-dicarboxylate transport system permease large subunit